MSAVAGFLLLMSSSLVRDIYQRNINPDVSPRTVRWVSYGTTAVVGVIVTLGALRPPRFLQYIIIFTGSGMGCTFLAATVLGLYWRRATRAGALAALVGGFVSVLALYVLGWLGVGKPTPAEIVSTYLSPLAATHPMEALPLEAGVRVVRRVGPAVEPFAPLYLFSLDPLIYGLLASFSLGIGVSLMTRPLPASHVDRYFLAEAAEPRKADPVGSDTG
jgi:SSS family solute:Na+ symporter/sodium/pantothenate symporter